MSENKLNTCGCCEGEERLTPARIYNRPGLEALAYRVGTQAAFFETMVADLSREVIVEQVTSRPAPAAPGEAVQSGANGATGEPGAGPKAGNPGPAVENLLRPLSRLKTRQRDDFSIALLDAWATIADVLAFYQERIANEGYLRTALERRSILELGRLVGYELAPGVAASTYLSFIVEQTGGVATIPKRSGVRSIPEPGEAMQSFETMRELEARYEYNAIKLRTAAPQYLENGTALPRFLYLAGQHNDLRPPARILLAFGTSGLSESFAFDDQASYYLARVKAARLVDEPDRTRVEIHPGYAPISNPRREMMWAGADYSTGTLAQTYYTDIPWNKIAGVIGKVGGTPVLVPEDVSAEAGSQDVGFQGAAALNPQFAENIYAVLGQEVAPLEDGMALRGVMLLPLQAYLHGHNAPFFGRTQETNEKRRIFETKLAEWPTPTELTEFENNYGRLEEEFDALVTEYVISQDKVDRFKSDLAEIVRETTGWQDYIEEWNQRYSAGDGTATITLASIYEEIGVGSHVVLTWRAKNDRGALETRQALFEVEAAEIISTSLFNTPATCTRLELKKMKGFDWAPTSMAVIRSTTVYAASEWVTNPVPHRLLDLAPLPDVHVVAGDAETWDDIADRYGLSVALLQAANPACDPAQNPSGQTLLLPAGRVLELDGIYKGLKPGRWVALKGMRTDIPLVGREVALVESVEHRYTRILSSRGEEKNLPGDVKHTFLTLAQAPGLPFRRATLRINANTVKATHGETARGVPPRDTEVVLGSGDGSQAHQRFVLPLQASKRLTYLPAASASGVKSTLEVYVGEVLWQERQTLLGAGPREHIYSTRTADDGGTAVIFGDGQEGARPPTGSANVWARYRFGIGRAGNVKAEQIRLLATRPAGVTEVSNWVPAVGGADPEGRDQARQNVGFAARTLDRLVSEQDYQDFTRTFAGIGKARAVYDPGAKTVRVWVAGQDNAPLQDSELVANLKMALQEHDGCNVAIEVEVYTPLLISLDATIWIAPDRLWEKVKPEVQAALESRFAFGQRELGQEVAASELVRAIQDVPGVVHVQITRLKNMTEEDLMKQASGEELAESGEPVEAACLEVGDDQLAFIDPAVPGLIVLQQPQAEGEGEDE